MSAQVSIVIVTYNSAATIQRCLASVFSEISRMSAEVFVVDNASEDGTRAIVAAKFPAVELLANSANVGFAAANNRAFADSDSEFILLLNPDAELAGGCIPALLHAIRARADLAVVGPLIHDPSGNLQFSIRRFPSVPRQFAESLFLHRVLGLSGVQVGEMVTEPAAYAKPHEVDWVSGAAMLVRRDAMDEVGPMDESFFLYSEEVDWCIRFRSAGWRIAFDPEARVTHRHVDGTGSAALYAELIRSKQRCFAKHHAALQAKAYKLAQILGLLLRTVGWHGISLIAPSRRARAKAQAAAYAAGLRAALSHPPPRLHVRRREAA